MEISRNYLVLIEEVTREEVPQEDEVPCLEAHNLPQGDHPRLIVGDVEDRTFSMIIRKPFQM